MGSQQVAVACRGHMSMPAWPPLGKPLVAVCVCGNAQESSPCRGVLPLLQRLTTGPAKGDRHARATVAVHGWEQPLIGLTRQNFL
jgi:hypothetical protein